MALRVIGAGLPRTGTESLRFALERLLGGRCAHMRTLPGHPFDCGPGWRLALEGGTPDWDALLEGYVAGVDWPVGLFWRELAGHWPDALVVLSGRDSTEEWLESLFTTVVPAARAGVAPERVGGHDLQLMMRRFAGTVDWDDRAVLGAAYDRWMAEVRATAPAGRLVEWPTGAGWEPLCDALDLPVPDEPFPWTNRRQDWRA
ncbi:sulfotransferase family protein [Nocardioides panaciterrulae]|uniref:Sulfotransferase family protein n=1 Tax=Nocardioides panaciterrulae TaxID=661492 RepID=A0A7Y9J9N6_9ACTN|nr:sulfotransferase family protein [Nocardioides panaciterrulae]NYD40296.1 hypothetical protein [Nocardioides panaciterrulae]